MSGYSVKKLIPAITALQGLIDKAMKQENSNEYMVGIALLADSHNMLVDIAKECKDANTLNFVIIPMHDVEGDESTQ